MFWAKRVSDTTGTGVFLLKPASMKHKQSLVMAALVCAASLLQFCSKNDSTITIPASTNTTVSDAVGTLQLPATVFNYSNILFPAHIANALSVVDNTPLNNPITNDGATLGRVLFYDKTLSKNNTISCGSCHRPDMSFSDSAIKSRGFLGGLTARHSMRLLNVRFYRSGKMFWDERSNTLEDQVLQPIQNTTEMGLTLDEVVTKVSTQTYYPALFQKAFGSTIVTTDKVSKALAQFVRSIVTYQSKYDKVKQGLASFTQDETDGETIFLTKGNVTCAGCHAPPMFLTSNPERPFALPDAADRGINNQDRFKSGSLRNIAATGSYFHNGSVATLNDMLASNIPQHGVAGQDRQKLLAFMQTLTDVTTIADVKFSNPFK
jgi:cytochrome c peroxidase